MYDRPRFVYADTWRVRCDVLQLMEDSVATTVKVSKPTPKQKAILDVIAGGRRISVRTVTKDGKPKSATTVETAKGTAVAGAKADRETVESCTKKGWLSVTGESSDPETSSIHKIYQITDEGKKAKKAK